MDDNLLTMPIRSTTDKATAPAVQNNLDVAQAQVSDKFVECRAVLRMASVMPKSADLQKRAADATRVLVNATRNVVQDLSTLPNEQQPSLFQLQEALHNAQALAKFAPTEERRSLGHYMAIKLVGRQDALEPGPGRSQRIAYTQIPQGPNGEALFGKAVVMGKTKQPKYRKTVDNGRGVQYDMEAVTHSGTFGQVRFARATDAQGARADFAVKVQRNHSKIGKSGPRTVVFRDMSEIAAEVTKAFDVPNKIEKLLIEWGYAGITPSNPFAGVRASSSSVAVLDSFVDDKAKVHMVMLAFDGNLLELRQGLQDVSAAVKRAVVDSVAAQAFTELAALHHGKRGTALAHRDLKLDNIVYNGQGAVKLIDFDTVVPTFRRGLPKVEGKAGTTVSPEMLRGGKLRLGLANDVWAMSASIFELLQPSDAKPSPFLTADIRSAAGRAGGMQADFFKAFSTYRELALASDSLTVDDAAFAQKHADPAMLAAKARLDAFFAAPKDVHPALTRMLLQEGMHDKPTRRQSARHMAKTLRTALPAVGTLMAGDVRRFFASAAKSSVKAATFAKFDA